MTKEQQEQIDAFRESIADHGFTVGVYGTRIMLEQNGDPMRRLGIVTGPSQALTFLEGVQCGLELAKGNGKA